ncbi:MAG: hypothetical protein IKI93_11970 [Clostridia bacterium]|nr:hypothetical protein [Clostridia bacterium]
MKDAEQKRDRENEILINASVTAGLVTVVGMFSNVLILLIGWIVSIPVFLSGQNSVIGKELYVFLAIAAQLFCIVGCLCFMPHLGNSAAQYRISNENSRRMDVKGMLVSTGLGVLLHGIACTALAGYNLDALFFAGPVRYLAWWISLPDTDLLNRTVYKIPFEAIMLAILIYIVLVFAAACIGYAAGYRKAVRRHRVMNGE